MQQALIQKEVAAAMKSFAEAKATTKKADDMEAQFVAKMILEEQTQREKSAIEAARVAIDQERAIAEAARVQIEAKQAQVESILRSQEIDAENARTAIESAIAVDKHYHDKSLDMANLKDI
jgi:hypothetical protein